MIYGSWIEKIRVCLNRQSSTDKKLEIIPGNWLQAPWKRCVFTGTLLVVVALIKTFQIGQWRPYLASVSLLWAKTWRFWPWKLVEQIRSRCFRKKGTMSCRHIGFIDVFQLTIGAKDHGLVRLETNSCDHFAMGICYLFSPASFHLADFCWFKVIRIWRYRIWWPLSIFVLGSKPKEHLKHSTAWPFLEWSDLLEAIKGHKSERFPSKKASGSVGISPKTTGNNAKKPPKTPTRRADKPNRQQHQSLAPPPCFKTG